MNSNDTFDDQHPQPPDPTEEEIAMLFHLAGSAPELPADQVAPIRERALEAFRLAHHKRLRHHRGWAAAAVAATLVLVLGGLQWSRDPAPPATIVVAKLALAAGSVTVNVAAGNSDTSELTAGSLISTGTDGLAAIELADATSIRLGHASRLLLHSDRRMELQSGALYVDSGPATTGNVEVATPFGLVTDIGTQFELRLHPATADRPAGLRIRVREGEVSLAGAERTRHVVAGHELLLHSDGATSTTVGADDDGWQWAANAAPPLAIEGLPMPHFLDWVARELGVQWESPLARRQLQEIVLHGSIEGLTPAEALDVVLTGSQLNSRRAPGVLEVSRK